MRFITFTFMAAAAAIPSFASGQQSEVATPAVTNPAAQNPGGTDEVVCKVEPPTTGTRLGARHECHSAAEWQRMWTAEQIQLFKAQVQIGEWCNAKLAGHC